MRTNEVIGKKVICPRCDDEVFLKYLGTTSAKFEEYPQDWTYISELGGSLCPDCSRQFKTWVRNFMGYGRYIAPAWSLDGDNNE